jgi:hypothetical protein
VSYFLVGHVRWVCELQDHGQWGIEAQFFRNEEFDQSRRWPTREEALVWEQERRDIETDRQ